MQLLQSVIKKFSQVQHLHTYLKVCTFTDSLQSTNTHKDQQEENKADEERGKRDRNKEERKKKMLQKSVFCNRHRNSEQTWPPLLVVVKQTGSQRLPDETETGSEGSFVVCAWYATSLTHFLSLSHIILHFCLLLLRLVSIPSSFLLYILHYFLLSHAFLFSFTIPHLSFSSFYSSFLSSNPSFVLQPCFSHLRFSSLLPSRPYFLPPSLPLSLSLSSGLSKDGGGSVNAESLEEVLNILAEEGSDWIYGFFTFLYDVVSSPVERGKEEKATDMQEEGGTTSSDDEEVRGVILDLQNQ